MHALHLRPPESTEAATDAQPLYGYIPLGLWLSRHHPELRGAARLLYMALGQFANAGNHRPSKRELRLVTGLAENTVDAALRELRRDGYLLVRLSDRSANTYHMLRGPWLDDPPPSGWGGGPPQWLGPLKSRKK